MEQSSTGNINGDFSGPPALHIPTEVCEDIIDMLYSTDTARVTLEHIGTLRSCALVCRGWRVRSQRMLFYLVQLSTSTSLRRLSTILDTAQHLRDYVYQIELTGYHLHNTTSIFTLFPAVFAGKLPNLERIRVGHLPEISEEWLPRAPDPPKSKPLPYIPLHPRFPAFLSSFTAVSYLYLESTTFRSFSDFVRMLHGLRNLEELTCHSVRWITPGGAHPDADFTNPPGWAGGGRALPRSAPRLRGLRLSDMDAYGVQRLIWMHGPHLTLLGLSIPFVSNPDDAAHGQRIDLSSCTRLQTLLLFLTPRYSLDRHAVLIQELLASWKPQHLQPMLTLFASRENEFTRRGFANALCSVGTITETWLQAVEEPPSEAGDLQNDHGVRYQLNVEIYDWDTEKEWWSNHVDSCFPTWLQLGRLGWAFRTPQGKYEEWAKEEKSSQSGTISVASRVDSLASCSRSKSEVESFP